VKSVKTILFISFLTCMLIPVRDVHADIAPPPAPQLGGLEPFGYQDTNVQMAYERVEMELQSFLPPEDETFPQSRVNVTAYFTMRNQGDLPESMQVIFPLESFSNCRLGFGGGNSYTTYLVNADSFQVLVNGNPVPVEKVVTEHPDKDVQGLGDTCKQMTWAGFDVTFPAGEDVVIRVEYDMESTGVDSMQNIEYILETGAGWAGPIQRGYVIVKFPYSASVENVLPESTPGYQFLYNEVYWSFENLEPTSDNNIQVSIVSPHTWQKIISLRRDLKENPKQPEKWLDLADTYFSIATWHWDNIRSIQYLQRIASVYEAGLANNPNNAELPAKYAEFKLYQWSPHGIGQIPEDQASPILSLLNRALALEPENGTAQMNLSMLLSAAPFITFTPPATIPPTATFSFTLTASITPAATKTPIPSAKPTSTEARTGSDQELETTPTPRSTATKFANSATTTIQPTSVSSAEKETGNQSPLSIAIIGMVATFIAGLVVGTLWSTLRKR
jgi:hypothetical protein